MLLRITNILSPLLLSAFYLSFVFLPAAYAEYIRPDEVFPEVEPVKVHDSTVINGSYKFRVSWSGLRVAKATVTTSDVACGEEMCKQVDISARTTSIVKLFYSLRHNSQSVFTSEIRPIHFWSKQKERRRSRSERVEFYNDGYLRSKRFKRGKEKNSYHFKPGHRVYDPISAAYAARSIELKTGNKVAVDVFNGKHRYVIDFEVGDLEELKIMGKTRKAYKVTPSVDKLTDSKGEKRLKSAHFWISADGRREILKLESEVFFGAVKAELVSFTPAEGDVALPERPSGK